MQVLMLSSSRKGSEEYLEHARDMILSHLGDLTQVLFIPYAGVSISWDEYTQKVQQALPELQISGIHQHSDPKGALANASAILVGGGNTFNLLHTLYENDLLTLIKQRVAKGMKYIGWSAGSNICGQSIRTTNDMPIIEPRSFTALGFVNAQLNPHYTDYVAPNHNGETRDQRIAEFCTLNPTTPVIGIREGSALQLKMGEIRLLGDLEGVMFTGKEKTVLKPSTKISV